MIMYETLTMEGQNIYVFIFIQRKHYRIIEDCCQYVHISSTKIFIVPKWTGLLNSYSVDFI